VLALKPAWAEVHNNLASALLRQGQLDRAITHYTEALQLKPGWALPTNNLGDAMLKQGKLDEATVWFARAAQLTPPLPEASYNLAGVLWQQGRHAAAIAAYREALLRRPYWPQAANHLAWLLVTQEHPSRQDAMEAVSLAERACQASGYRHAMPLRTLAAAYHATGREAEAVEVTRHALTIATATQDQQLSAEITTQLQQYKGMPTSQALP
jgi:tetratricopeptide (TPR) repeat protein